MYKVMVKYPEAVPLALPRMKEKLEDEDSGACTKFVWRMGHN